MSSTRTRLVQGLVTGVMHEAFIVIVSFGAMLVLVRLLTPRDYGEAAAVFGVLALLRAFNGALFVEHALQHDKDDEPDWDNYVAIGGLVQVAQFAVANGIALVAAIFATTSSLSTLLHIASVGLLLEWPAQVASVKLRRELRFARLRLITAFAVITNLSTAIVLAWLGYGAIALIVGGNVATAAPMAIGFLFVERWRPRERWLFLPPRPALQPILTFGRAQIAAGLLQSIRSAAESVVLTNAFGLTIFGLVNRAIALFQSTVGRLTLVFLDTAYPLLPMQRADHDRYRARAGRFIEAALVLAIPGAAFIAVNGAQLSRVLYGGAWAEADPYLAPAAIALSASTLASAASYVLLGFNSVRHAVVAESFVAVAGLAALVVTALTSTPATYVWALALAQVLAAVAAFTLAAPLLEPEWQRRGLWPAAAASAVASAGVWATRQWMPEGLVGLSAAALVYSVLAGAVLAITARSVFTEVLHLRNSLLRRVGLMTPSQAQA
jgi:O-antigen/teichoic acid export membrane protein